MKNTCEASYNRSARKMRVDREAGFGEHREMGKCFLILDVGIGRISVCLNLRIDQADT